MSAASDAPRDASPDAALDGSPARALIAVWDWPLRCLHWLLAAGVLVAWASGHWLSTWFDEIHHSAGYLVGAVVALRLVWGFGGGRYARFRQFLRSPRQTWAYVRRLRAGDEPRYIGHNPLGGWMALALLGGSAASSLTGWLYTTDWLWGYQWLAQLHAMLAWLMVALVLGHWVGVFFTGRRQRENLVAAMFTGRKAAGAPGEVDD